MQLVHLALITGEAVLENTLLKGTKEKMAVGRQSLEARHAASLSSVGECLHAVRFGTDGLI